jgi:hypothetical protein
MAGICLTFLVTTLAIASTLGDPPQKNAWSFGVAASHGSERDEIIGGGIILYKVIVGSMRGMLKEAERKPGSIVGAETLEIPPAFAQRGGVDKICPEAEAASIICGVVRDSRFIGVGLSKPEKPLRILQQGMAQRKRNLRWRLLLS